MTANIQIYREGKLLPLKIFDFPGGEVGVKVDFGTLGPINSDHIEYQTIFARLKSAKDIMTLAMVKDALNQADDVPVRLAMGYVPYARQDRVCVPGESFSLKVFANIINGLNFDRVTIIDPHSDVTPALFERLHVITQLEVINHFDTFIAAVMKNNSVFVSPDAGANKKTYELAHYFSHPEFIRADKLRDMHNKGAIKETIVYADDLKHRTVVIADDICDGGRTFIELAKVLKKKGAKKVILYVTHGIFSKGIDALLKEGIDEIYTTNSYLDMAMIVNKELPVKYLDLEEFPKFLEK